MANPSDASDCLGEALYYVRNEIAARVGISS